MRLSLYLSCTFALIILLISFRSLPTPAHAAGKMQIAVLDLQPKGVPKVVAGGVTDLLRAHLVDVGVFTVVERSQMGEILKEQGFQMTGCTDQACAVQVGQLLSANKILVGEVTRLGNSILITVRIVDVEKGVGEFATRETAANEDLLEEATEKLSKKLIERITGKSMAELFQEFEVETKTGYYLRSIVPGWGQFYAGKSWKGYVFSGAFVAAAAFSTYAVMDYGKKKKDYDDLPYGTPEKEFDAAYDDYQKAGNVTLMSFGILGAVYLAHWADVLFFSRPDFEKKESAGTWKEGLYLNIYTDAGSPLLPERRTTLAITMRF